MQYSTVLYNVHCFHPTYKKNSNINWDSIPCSAEGLRVGGGGGERSGPSKKLFRQYQLFMQYLCTYDLYGPVRSAFDLMRAASITRASGRGLGPGNLDFLEPQIALAYRLDVISQGPIGLDSYLDILYKSLEKQTCVKALIIQSIGNTAFGKVHKRHGICALSSDDSMFLIKESIT